LANGGRDHGEEALATRQVARRADRQAGAGAAPSTCATTGFGIWWQQARHLHAAAQIGGLGLEAERRAPLGHRLDVAADAEGAAAPLSSTARTS